MKNSLATLKPDPAPAPPSIELTPEYVAKVSSDHNGAAAALEAARKAQAHASVTLDAAVSRGVAKAEHDELRHRLQDAEADVGKTSQRLDDAKAKLAVVREMVAAQERQAAADANANRLTELSRLTTERQEAADALGAAMDQMWPAWQRFAEATNALRPHIGSTNKNAGGLTAGACIAASDVDAAMRLHLCKIGFRWAIAWPWELAKIPSLPQRIRTANDYLIQSEGGAQNNEKAS